MNRGLSQIISENTREEIPKGKWYGHYNTSRDFINGITKLSRTDGVLADEYARNSPIGRECYSFSEVEDNAFIYTKEFAVGLASKEGLIECKDYTVEEDAIGNMYIRVIGDNDSTTHMVGSHLDSVENGGKYDGVAGIAAGMETLQQTFHYKKQGGLKKSFTLAVFRSEESGPHNGVACLGSAVATGTISKEKLEKIIYKKENGKKITLREHIESKFSEKRWQQILSDLEIPKISPETVASYHELHIEQGTLISGAEKHLGIVSGGIGGSKRYKSEVSLQKEEVNTQEFKSYSFSIKGVSDHTGATPNNMSLKSKEFRKDAVIASVRFLKQFQEEGYGYLISCQSENKEGFTKVPFHQNLNLCIHKGKEADFLDFFARKKRKIESDNGVEFTDGKIQNIRGKTIEVISENSSKTAISILIDISQSASDEFQRQKEQSPKEKEFGTTRCTMTNVHIKGDSMIFDMDLREVNTNDVHNQLGKVQGILMGILQNQESTKILWNVVYEKAHTQVNELLRSTLEVVAKILQLEYILIPSIPGHDADRVGATGVPVAMVFVKQVDGLSHNPAEKMDMWDYGFAMKVMMNAVLAKVV